MKNKLTWLHISDIHFNQKSDWRDETFRKSLLDYLKMWFSDEEQLRPDLIFCTGDIAFGETSRQPLREQYDQAKQFFDSLLTICGSDDNPLSKDHLFVVPGNHDINRNNVNSDAQSTLTQWAASSGSHIQKIEQRFADRAPELTSAMTRLSEYGEFLKNYLPHQYDERGLYIYSKEIEISGRKVGIAGFNSAWSCYGSEDDRNLWLGARFQFNEAHRVLSNSDIRIGLIHHPIDWLNQSDRETAMKRITSDFDFWLHGHSHDAWVTAQQSHVQIAAGAVGATSNEEFGINLTQVLFDREEVSVYLHKNGNSIPRVDHRADSETRSVRHMENTNPSAISPTVPLRSSQRGKKPSH